jgi:uncharacterized membrane protein (GlpM family)
LAVPAQNLAVKVVVTPVLIGGASLAGRRFGHHVGGWLVALPMTSGPVAFFLAVDQGVSFAAGAAIGMLAATLSQVAFALAYSRRSARGATAALLAGGIAFAASTFLLSFLHWSAWETFVLVLCSLAVGYVATRRDAPAPVAEPNQLPRWDIPVRMVAATLVVVVITTLAPALGSHLAGLLSPFPVFAAVLAVFTHHTHGPVGARQTLHGLLLGLLAPAVFFLVLAVTLEPAGLWAFALSSAAAFAAQTLSLFAIPRGQHSPTP